MFYNVIFLFLVILVIESKEHKIADISQSEYCKNDVQQFCDHIKQGSNLELLQCLQRSEKIIQYISKPCQHFLWNFKKDYLNIETFNSISNNNCKNEATLLKNCINENNDKKLVCLLKHRDKITNKLCLLYLEEAANIIFSDIILVSKFLTSCNEDIDDLRCGRLQGSSSVFHEEPVNITSQAETVNCLVMSISSVRSECRKQILRLGELQSDDFRHNPSMFYACREDREIFCASVDYGNSQVYRCLEKNKDDNRMSEGCRAELYKKQKLEGFDYKIRKYFSEKCAKDISSHKCVKSSDDRDSIKLSNVILCLLKADAEESKEHRLEPHCRSEVLTAREQFAKHPQMSSSLQSDCAQEIKKYCSSINEKTDNIIHCLMRNSMPALEHDFSVKCTLTMKKFVKVVDPTEHIAQLDPVISLACSNELKTKCSKNTMIEPDDRYECLLQQIDAESETDKISEECKTSLITLAYFVERDYSLNHKLHRSCQKDVRKLCKVALKKEADPQSLVPHAILHCLVQRWNGAFNKSSLSYKCEMEIKAIMKIESSNLKLNFRVYSSCFSDVMNHCANEKYKMDCLQLKYHNLQEVCKNSITEFLSLDKEEYSLKKLIVRSCGPMIRIFCKSEMNAKESDYMTCLERSKFEMDMDKSCRIAIEHYQIIGLEDYKINHKFTRFCSTEIKKFCGPLLLGAKITDIKDDTDSDDESSSVTRKPTSKSDIITCLSKTLTKNLLQKKNPFSTQCYEQFTFEFLQQADHINLDPEMHHKCERDINLNCASNEPDKIVRCLQQYQESLSQECYALLVNRQLLSALDTQLDAGIQRYCKEMMETYCPKELNNKIFRCLHINMRHLGFNQDCKSKIINRLQRRLANVKLNPELIDNCRNEITMYCNVSDLTRHIADINHKEKLGIVNCLRTNFVDNKERIRGHCRQSVFEIVLDAHSHYRLDPNIYDNCRAELKTLCHEDVVKGDIDMEGRVNDCLKRNLLDGKIKEKMCSHEIYRLLREGRADVHVDIQLYNACSDEIARICYTEHLGAGKKLACLLWALDDKHVLPFISKNCATVLAERKQMWELASKLEAPDNVQQVLGLIVESRARFYILMMLMSGVLGILVVGIVCGRMTKRAQLRHKRL